MSWSFTIPVEVPSANVLRRKYRHPKAYMRLRQAFGWAVKVAGREVPPATGMRVVTVTRLIPKRGQLYDSDNLIGGAKPLIDELVANRLIVGDRVGEVSVIYQQERSGAPRGSTRIELEDHR